MESNHKIKQEYQNKCLKEFSSIDYTLKNNKDPKSYAFSEPLHGNDKSIQDDKLEIFMETKDVKDHLVIEEHPPIELREDMVKVELFEESTKLINEFISETVKIPGKGGRPLKYTNKTESLTAKSQQKKIRRSIETEEQRLRRLSRMREAEKRRRANETEEQRQQRLFRLSEAEKRRRANESEEQRQKRLQRLSQAEKRRRANETEEERQKRLTRLAEAQRRRIANETEEQRQQRLARIAQKVKNYRENETEEQRQRRLARCSQWQKERRANETEEQRQRRLAHHGQKKLLINESYEPYMYK